MIFSAADGCDVGVDTGSPVSDDYGPHGNAFTGRVKGVQIALAEAAESLGPPRLAGGRCPYRDGAT